MAFTKNNNLKQIKNNTMKLFKFTNTITKNIKMSKKILVVLLAAFSLNGFAQQKDAEWHTDVNKAINISIQTGKPLFFFFTGSDWCGWCKKLQKEVFFKPEFKKWANSSVVLVELDFPRRTPISDDLKKQNRELGNLFGVRGYPTGWFTKGSIIKNALLKRKKITGSELNYSTIIIELQKNTQTSSYGSQGYVAGGPKAWIAGANKILSTKK
jgi:thiol-disulfide isomerase/thioredoxin